MTGSIQEKHGFLQIVLQYKNKEGRKCYKWISTGLCARGNKKKAAAMIPAMIEKYKVLEVGEGEEHLLTQLTTYCDEWLTEKKGDIRQSTWETYEIYLRLHIKPFFEPLGMKLKDLTPKDVKNFYQYLCEKTTRNGQPLSGRSIKKIAALLKLILTDAVNIEDIPRNPALTVPIPKQLDAEPFKGQALTVDECKKLLEALKGNELEALVRLTLIYGLRRSEVLGLRWSAVDFDRESVEINHTRVRVTTLTASDTTKTASSHRIYPMTSEVRDLLMSVKAKQDEYKELFGDCYIETDYVFTRNDGKPLMPDSVSQQFSKLLKDNGLPPIRFHDLRHTCASLLQESGWSEADAKEWLGHSDIQTTINIYTHLSKTRKMQTATSLQNLLNKP